MPGLETVIQVTALPSLPGGGGVAVGAAAII